MRPIVIPAPTTNDPGNMKIGLKMTTTVRLVSMITAYAVKIKRRWERVPSTAAKSCVNLVRILAVGVSSIQLKCKVQFEES
jgi:hypothetical protein